MILSSWIMERVRTMNWSFTLAISALVVCIGCEMIKPSPGRRITEQQDQPQCGFLIASHRSSLEFYV